MTTADIVRFFQIRRALPFRDALARAELIVIRRTLRPDSPRGIDREQLRIPFEELKYHGNKTAR